MTKFQALLKEFGEAVEELDRALARPKDEFMRDSAIKRFELTFDLAWKAIKAFLEEKGVVCSSPAACFKEAYHQGIIEYDERWLELIKTRNKTVHTYDEKLAEEVYRNLPASMELFHSLYAYLKTGN